MKFNIAVTLAPYKEEIVGNTDFGETFDILTFEHRFFNEIRNATHSNCYVCFNENQLCIDQITKCAYRNIKLSIEIDFNPTILKLPRLELISIFVAKINNSIRNSLSNEHGNLIHCPVKLVYKKNLNKIAKEARTWKLT